MGKEDSVELDSSAIDSLKRHERNSHIGRIARSFLR